jgi:hypothetical protein
MIVYEKFCRFRMCRNAIILKKLNLLLFEKDRIFEALAIAEQNAQSSESDT